MMALGGKTLLQRLRTAAGMGPPITTFAALPSAGSVPGQLRQLSDVNNIIVQSRGGIWRPYGGSQVLAMRVLNPVTVQSLTNTVAETIGPFPGGLVRAGMRLELATETGVNVKGGTVLGVLDCRINSELFRTASGSSSTQTALMTEYSSLQVLSDTNAVHNGRGNGPSYGILPAQNFPTINFSVPWTVAISLRSNSAETAVNITSASWAAGIATYGTSAVHTLAVGDKTVIAGITPTGYNVAAGAIVLSVPTTTSFTVAMAADPGAYTSGGTSSRISNMVSQSFVLSLLG